MEQCRATSKQSGKRCKRPAAKGKHVCFIHGGAPGSGGGKGGRPGTHNLYSRCLQDDPELLAAYEYYKTNPKLLDMTPEIAMSQAYLDQFVRQRKAGAEFSSEYIGFIADHVDKVTKFKEREAKRQYNERVVSEVISHQVAKEAEVLAAILSKHLDPETAQKVANEFATAVCEECSISPSVSL